MLTGTYRMKILNNFSSFRRAVRQLGQGMTEYIILVMLIAIGSITVYTQFGDVLRNQMAAAAKTLAGQDGGVETASAQRAANAAASDTSRNLGNAAGSHSGSSGEGDGSSGGSGSGGGDSGSSSDGSSGGGDAGVDGLLPPPAGAFEPPPPAGGAPGGKIDDVPKPGTSPLTDDVMALVCESKTLCNDVKKWVALGVKFEYTTGGAGIRQHIKTEEKCVTAGTKWTCTEKTTTTTIVYINNGDFHITGVVQQIAHEVGHLESTVVKPRAEDVPRDVFVQSRLEDEAAAVMYNIKVQREILAKTKTDTYEGTDISVNCGMANQTECHTRYESIYNDYVNKKISEGTALKKIADLRAIESTMEGIPYPKYYGDEWDKRNPSTP
jgi:hypothetical protein